MTPEEAATRLAGIAVDAQQEEYKEMWEQWKAIDTKAQGVIVVSGIALTGVFAVLREKPPADCISRVLVTASVAATIVAAVCALMALRVRSVQSAPFGDRIASLARDVQTKEES